MKRTFIHPKFIILTGLILIFAVAYTATGRGADPSANSPLASAFEAYVFKDPSGGCIPYRLLRPLDASRKLYPLVLFLHGSGERGSDNKKNLNYIVQIFGEAAMRRQYPAFVIVPQCPQNQNWVQHESYFGGAQMTEKPTEAFRLTVELVRSLMGKYPIDPDRLFVVGLSSGGSGAWEMIARYPDWFAAAAPFCGSGDPSKADRLTRLPIWAFHGGMDVVVNPNTTRTMIAAVRKAGGKPKFTEYPNLGHNCWYKAFHNPAFFQWLFAQKRSQSPKE